MSSTPQTGRDDQHGNGTHPIFVVSAPKPPGGQPQSGTHSVGAAGAHTSPPPRTGRDDHRLANAQTQSVVSAPKRPVRTTPSPIPKKAASWLASIPRTPARQRAIPTPYSLVCGPNFPGGHSIVGIQIHDAAGEPYSTVRKGL